jgi:hypothetical protein
MPRINFPQINYEYKRYLSAACPNHDNECYYNVLLGANIKLNVEVIANLWNTLGDNIFPELCSDFVSDRYFNPNGVSIAVSGGGSRSYTSMIGYIRALLELDVYPGKNAFTSAQFISSVSGGSWFTGTYLMAMGTNNYSSKQLLGNYIEPININYITLNKINFDNNYFMGQSPSNAPVLPIMNEARKNGIKTEFLWNYAIGKIFLEKYNLLGSITSQNEYYSSIMQQLNPSLPIPKLPPQDFPFWICNASLIDNSIVNNGCTQIQFTPLYSGFPQILGTLSDNNIIGGSWVNTYAFGSLPPNQIIKNTNCNNNLLHLSVPLYQGGPLTLENMIGTSSAAYGYDTYAIAEKEFGKLVKLNPTYNFLCPLAPFKPKISYTGDGGVAENTGIMNLAARNCKFIIAFNNTPQEFNNSFTGFCNSSLLPLFGLYSNYNCPNMANQPNIDSVQIFESNSWASFSQQFLDTSASGGPSYARAKLNVLPNSQNGVTGNYIVDLLVISLQSSSNFNNLLPTEISSTFSDSHGPFPNFPNYATLYTNRIEVIQLTKSQINLLQCYCYWSINDISNLALKNEIIDMYTKAAIY